MERRFRDVTVKKRKRSLQTVVIGILLGLGLIIGSGTSAKWAASVLVWSVNSTKPAILKFLEEQDKNRITFLYRFIPRIFGFVEENNGMKLQVTYENPENAAEESREEQLVSTGNVREPYASGSIKLILTQDIQMALLQENIYEEKIKVSDTIMQQEKLTTLLQENSQMTLGTLSDLTNNVKIHEYEDMVQLIKDFYIIDASTSPDAALLNVDALTAYDCSIDKESAEPQILIYHSHSQEGFADSVPGDASTTIVGAGRNLAALLKDEYGYQVMHHEGVYDLPSRDNAYSNALPAIEKILEDHPSIQVVIDLHRDAVGEGTRLVQEINGKKYARFMFFNGICRSTKGPITYLNNPYLKENLAFSFQSQLVAEECFPGITRKIYLKAWRYNMHLVPRNMLIELGAQTNTVEEIMNTTEILAFIIDKVLSGQ